MIVKPASRAPVQQLLGGQNKVQLFYSIAIFNVYLATSESASIRTSYSPERRSLSLHFLTLMALSAYGSEFPPSRLNCASPFEGVISIFNRWPALALNL